MKQAFLPLAIGLFLILTPSFVSAFPGETDVTYLNNKDVLTMVQNHVPEEAIIRTIKSSPCTFDTFPPVLKDLKRRGVPDAVLQAMVEAPYGPSAKARSTDDLAAEDQPIYHYADQLRQMGYISPSSVSRASRFRPSRTRASRRRQ
ncbi:MAG TPA: hypothetical protein VJM50_01390 [Pyrinomonadaceae bacterium]|nr:hypothetical protein [Pyrinomonadaceae bacterium]